MNVPVNLDINPKTKSYTIKVLSPSVSALIKKELSIESGSGARKKTLVGNIALEQVIAIAKIKHPNMLAKEFISALKSVIGTCMSLGILIDSKDPKEILEEIESGKYHSEITHQKTEVSSEKKKQLTEFFSKIKSQQDAIKKKEEEEKAAAEAAKAAEATAKASAGAPAATAATPTAAKPEAKPEAKKKQS
jgi:hypothetical protein